MQEYVRTMERFLELQQQVMQTYLAQGDSANIAMSRSQTSNFQVPEGANDATESAFPDRDVSDASPAYLNAGPTESTRESGALPGSRSTDILDKEGIEKLLLSCISEKTGYPPDMLTLNQNLEADLGIDSIKRVEILGALLKQIGSLEEAEIGQLNALKTLREMVESLAALLKKASIKGEEQPGEEENHPPEMASARPLIGKLVRMTPGREVIAIREINLEEDLFLHHHTLGGEVSQNDETLLGLPVFPLSMSLELMAEVAVQLFPGKRLIGMKNIQAHNWIVLEDQRITLEVHARVRPGSSENIDAQLRILEPTSSQTETRLAVEGTMIFGDAYPEAPTAGAFQLRSEKPAGLSPQQFYPYALFHGPLFQSVATLNRSGDNGVEAALEVPAKHQLFRSTSNPLFLSDPVMLDGAGQVVGLWAASHLDTNFVVFPIGLEEVRFYASPLQPSARATCQVRTSLEGDAYIRSEVHLLTVDGSLQAQLKGLQHKRIKMPKIFHLFRGSREVMLSTPWQAPVEQFATPERMICCRLDQIPMEYWEADARIWRAVLAHIVLSRREREIWRKLKGPEKRRTEWLLARIAGKDAVRLLLKERYGMQVWPADVEIQADDHGRPAVSGEWIGQVEGSPLLSLAHSKGIAIALAADGEGNLGVGIDIELLRPVTKEFKELALIPEEQNLMSSLSGAGSREWLLRIWCAKEAVAKALGKGLMGIPRDLIVRKLDSKTGVVSLELSGKFAQQFPQLTNKCLQAYTLRDNNLILASAIYTDGDRLERQDSREDGATISSSLPEANGMPFIGSIISYRPGEELSTLRQFDLEEDIFLLDHTLGREISVTDRELTGLPMMPLTVSMELMAEAAFLLLPNKLCIGMRDIRAYRWITFDEKRLTLRVEARRQSAEEVRVRLWDANDSAPSGTSVGLPVLEGTIVFGERYPEPPVLGDFPLRGRQPSIWSPEKLYSEGMFHGPRFQGVTSVDWCGEDGTEATLRAMPLDGFFRSRRAPRFVTDHVLLDTAGQLVAYWNAHHRENGFSTYPFRVEALHIYGSPLRPPEKAKGRARIRPLAENQFRADIDVIGPDGLLHMRVVGWDDRSFDLPTAFYRARFRTREVVLSTPWPEVASGFPEVEALQCCGMKDYPDELLYAHGKIWLQVLAHLVLSRREREIWRRLPDSQKRSAEWVLARVAGKDAVRLLLKKQHGIDLCPSDIEIDSDDHGHPIAKGLWTKELNRVPSLSISHTKGIGTAMAAEGGVGCGIDVERLDSSREGIGQIVLNREERDLLNSLVAPGDVEWHLRIGCAKKAAARALGRGSAREPRDLIVRDLDTGLGMVSLEASGTLAQEFPQLKGKRYQAQTMRERDLILASAVWIEGDQDEK
jgi:phosphopantetheinyl transferase/acyl carrier protein